VDSAEEVDMAAMVAVVMVEDIVVVAAAAAAMIGMTRLPLSVVVILYNDGTY